MKKVDITRTVKALIMETRPFQNIDQLQDFLNHEHVTSLLVIGCEEYNWQSFLNSVEITTIDITDDVMKCVEQHLPITCMVCENLEDTFDAVLVRDVVQYLPCEDGRRVLTNAVKHARRFIIINHTPDLVKDNHEITFERFHHVNLHLDPFEFSTPLTSIPDRDNCTLSIWDVATVPSCYHPVEEPTILVAILARNKEYTLPDYLSCLYNQTYPKNRMILYVRTNDNYDATQSVLENWLNLYGHEYLQYVYDTSTIHNDKSLQHLWTETMSKIRGHVRNVSLLKTLEYNCDFYFVADCDNFLVPETLEHLINLNRPLVAPMLNTIPNTNEFYSNYFTDVTENGYFKSSPEYLQYRYCKKRGCFEVPVVHSTYLIQRQYIPQLTYQDDTDRHEFIIFSESARHHHIKQYLCNEITFGSLFHPPGDISPEDAEEVFENFKANHPLIF